MKDNLFVSFFKHRPRQTLTCGLLSVALLIGLGLNYLYGLWQADPIFGLLIALFLVREGHRTVKEEKLCTCASCGLPPPAAPPRH